MIHELRSKPIQAHELGELSVGQGAAHQNLKLGVCRVLARQKCPARHLLEANAAPWPNVGPVVDQLHPRLGDDQVLWVNVVADNSRGAAAVQQRDQVLHVASSIRRARLVVVGENGPMSVFGDLTKSVETGDAGPSPHLFAEKIEP